MDTIVKAFDISFLDLSGVEEQERNQLLASLNSENSHVQLPWKIPAKNALVNHRREDGNFINGAPPQGAFFDRHLYVTTSPYNLPPQQNQYFVYTTTTPTVPPSYYPPQQPTFYPTAAPPFTPVYNNNIAPQSTRGYDDSVNKTPSPPLSSNQNGGVVENGSTNNKSWASLFASKQKNSAAKLNNGIPRHDDDNAKTAVTIDDGKLCPIRHARRAANQFVDPHRYRIGEFLVNHTVDGRTISVQPRGLINRSNYCYVNSILQALLACPPMYNLLMGLARQNSDNIEKIAPIIDGMCRFVKEYQHLPAGSRVNRRNDKKKCDQRQVAVDCDVPFEPTWIQKMLNGVRSDSFLVEGRQEDAEEFLGFLLNGLNDEMLELMKLVKTDLIASNNNKTCDDVEEWQQVVGSKNKGGVTRQADFVKTPISDIFGGFLRSRIHRTGDHSTYNIQPFFTLQLNIEKVNTVREALEALVMKNQLEGFTSEKTNEQVEAWQQVTLEELPVILVLHLKCFDFKLDGCTKIIKALEFPIDLKIDSKLLSSKPMQAKEKQYKLFAVVYHDGKEATKGHYITDAFHVGYSSWVRYDDASVKAVQEEHVLKPRGTKVPYLLFYRRSDTIKSK